MKIPIKAISLVLMLVIASALQAQQSGISNEIIVAFKQGNVSKLTPYIGNNIELIIGSQNDIYSKQQALEIVSDFFKKNTIIDFQILHSGTKDSSSFIIGSLKAYTGTFRVSILTRKTADKTTIQQLRIEPSNE